jgi:hypothetical protein
MASTSNDRLRSAALGIVLGAWMLVVVPTAGAQEVDSRWAPWVGCWLAVDETETAPLLCVVPLAGEPAVEMLTVVDGQAVAREPIFADGQEHEVSREGCEGWERAEFSDDSHRIYVRSELSCGASGTQNSTGVLSMLTPFEWLDVRTMEVDGQSVPWVIRYRLASRAEFQAAGQADLIGVQVTDLRLARVAASAPIDLDDVIEASQHVSAETAQVWVVERNEPFSLDADRLIRMADAGVPPNVIDAVVAVSYPDEFVVNDDGALAGRRPEEFARGRRSLGYGRGVNPFIDPFYDPYSRYGYYSPYGSGFGFGYYGGYGYGRYGFSRNGGSYGGYGGYGRPVVIVGRRSDASSGAREGRVVRGGGYTSAGGGGQSTGRSAQPRSSGAGARSSGSSGASARSAPAQGSSGSAGRSTGRTAQPRPGGGN